MKINKYENQYIKPYNPNQNKVEKQLKTEKPPLDKIEISIKAKEMQEISQFSQERKTRVEELKKTVENREYIINAKEVAKSMLKYYNN